MIKCRTSIHCSTKMIWTFNLIRKSTLNVSYAYNRNTWLHRGREINSTRLECYTTERTESATFVVKVQSCLSANVRLREATG